MDIGRARRRQIAPVVSVPFPRAEVWKFFSDLDRMTHCMPGARLTKPVQGRRAEGEVNVKIGPIVSAFHGILDVERDDARFRGIVRGAGRDAKVLQARAQSLPTMSAPWTRRHPRSMCRSSFSSQAPWHSSADRASSRMSLIISPASSRKISRPGFPAGR